MREFDPFPVYPPAKRVANRTIQNRLAAMYRDREFYDGDRQNGFGGMVNDGRWAAVADQLIKVYGLTEDSSVLQVSCHKGFLLDEFLKRGINVRGTEVSDYAISCASEAVRPCIKKAPFHRLPFGDHEFDLVLGIATVYAVALPECVGALREMERVGKGKSFITLSAYETPEGLALTRKWSILGTLIFSKEEWLTVLNYAGYTGDYKFDTAEYLGLVSE